MADLFQEDKSIAEIFARIDEKAVAARADIADMARQANERINRMAGQQIRRMAERIGL